MGQDIIELVNEKEAQSRRCSRRGVIITPGAIGDCLLMLPLAKFIKESCKLGRVEFIGHTEYIDFYPGRTCVDGIRSIDSIDFHRFFTDAKDFWLEDGDMLITAFERYSWIVSFLGEGDNNFEENLISTVHCSHSAEVTTLPLVAKGDLSGHIGEFYINQFHAANTLWVTRPSFSTSDRLIEPAKADIRCGQRLLQSQGVDPAGRVVIIHPGSGGREKCWHVDNFCRLAVTLAKKDMQVVFLLGPAELERFDDRAIKKIEGAGKCVPGLGLCEVMQIIACTNLYVGNDSGITHLAAGLGASTLAIFGSTNPVIYGPIGPRVTIFNAQADSFSQLSSESVQQAANIVLSS
ncbi:MAG: glycosyltransferase family 9 protein [Planctomycetota bacterium]|jgi:hypothetical protein